MKKRGEKNETTGDGYREKEKGRLLGKRIERKGKEKRGRDRKITGDGSREDREDNNWRWEKIGKAH